MLSDLRESGQIESDADEVDFLYRDDYYNPDSQKKNLIEVIIAKGRNTGTGLVEMAFMKSFGKFMDLNR
jgi:replicative DNA helicase